MIDVLENVILKENYCSCDLKEKNVSISIEESYRNRQESLNISISIIKEKCYYYKCTVKQIQT